MRINQEWMVCNIDLGEVEGVDLALSCNGFLTLKHLLVAVAATLAGPSLISGDDTCPSRHQLPPIFSLTILIPGLVIISRSAVMTVSLKLTLQQQ